MRDNVVLVPLPNVRGQRSRSSQPIAQPAFAQAWQAFLAEQFDTSLHVISEAVTGALAAGASAAEPDRDDVPTLFDGILLWARNLYQLDLPEQFASFRERLVVDGILAADCPELAVVEMGFDFKQGRYPEVVAKATAFIADNSRGLPPVLADYLYLRGLSRSYLGDAGGARRDTESAFALFRIQAKKFEGARAANLMGILHFRASEFRDADRWFKRALQLHEELGLRTKMGGNHLNLGICAYKRGMLTEAQLELDRAEHLLAGPAGRVSRCRLGIAQGAVRRLRRDFAEARKILLESYETASEMRRPREEALALEFLGDVLRDESKIAQARRYYSRALAIGRNIAPGGDIVMEVMRRQGECLHLSGRHQEALPVLGQSLTLARRQGDLTEEGVVQRVLAEVMLALGDLQTAEHYAKESCDHLREVGAKHELGLASAASARIRLARVESGLESNIGTLLNSAWQDAMTSLDIFLSIDVDHWIIDARRLLDTITSTREEQRRLSALGAAGGRSGHGRNQHRALPIVHVSNRMRDLIELCDAFADSEEPVLITGETGTGKEIFTHRLHERSRRRSHKLVCVNVPAIPASIFEREVFGHVRGAFSGAETDRIGLAAQADGGTLFLDEIGELPLDSQPKLLRLLQEGTYQAIGDPNERHANIRLVAATNANLPHLVAEGRFRADLYYRLNILELKLPQIRERREDILPLLQHFLNLAAGKNVDPSTVFNRQSLEQMQVYDWPGNAREIAMVARQAWVQLASRGRVVVSVGPEGTADHDELRFTGPQSVPDQQPSRLAAATDRRSRIMLALAEADGNRAEAARRLGVSRSTLYRHLEKMGLSSKV